MDSESKAEKPQRRKRITGAGGCALAAAVVIVLAGLAGLAVHMYDRGWERRLQGRLDKLRAAGQPVTWEEVLAAREQIPDEENSALILLEAFDHLVEQRDEGYEPEMIYEYEDAWPVGARHSERVQQLVRSYLTQNAEALRFIHEAGRFPRGKYPLTARADLYGVEFDHLLRVRQVVRLCVLDGTFHAEMGDAEGAASSLVAARRVIASIGDEPTELSVLVRIGGECIWQSGLERSLELCEFPVEQLQMLREEIAREEDELSLELPLLGGRAFVVRALQQSPLAGLYVGQRRSILTTLHSMLPGWRDRNTRRYLELMNRAIMTCSVRPPQRLKEARALAQECDNLSPRYGFARAVLGIVGTILQAEAMARGRLAAAHTALAVEEWRLKHGGWPASLDELVPEFLDALPDDPCSEGPLYYVKADTSVLIYSVSVDGKDNGGMSENDYYARRGAPEEWDLPFRLLNPELRGATTLSFRDDVMNSYVTLQHLEDAGFPREKLEELGFSADDLKELQRR